MSLTFKTPNPGLLLSTFKKGIDDRRIVTWSYDREGDFTHTPLQWKNKAWLRPELQLGRLELYILNPRDTRISSEVYSVYHGRFIEAMLAHCDRLFSDGTASALASGKDSIGTQAIAI